MKTLKTFLEKHDACQNGFNFAKDLTLEQFLNTCQRGDWILWLFKRTNPKSFRQLTLAKAHCANTVRHLMRDKRSIKALDIAIAFGENRASETELQDAHADAYAAARAYADARATDAYAAAYADAYAAARAYADARATAYAADAYARAYADARATDAYAAERATAYAADAAAAWITDVTDDDAAWATWAATASIAARKQNQKLTADICRKYLPLEIWDQSQF